MKKLMVLLSLVLSFQVHAAKTPIPPEIEKRLQGNDKLKVVKVVYDTALGATSGSSYPLGVTLPAKAIIWTGVIHIDTQFADSGTGTVALTCEDSGNIKNATDITGSAAGALIALQPVGSAATAVSSIAERCVVTATVGGADQTAGKLSAWLFYFVHD